MANKKQEKLVFDTLPEDQKDFFIQSLEKKVRNLNKKLKEIHQLEKDRKEGKELKDTQLNKIASKDEHNNKKKELDSIARLYIEAKVEAASEKKEGETVAATTTTVPSDAVAQLANLFFAAQYAYQTNSNTDLALYFTNVFNNVSVSRVAHATTELASYLAGQHPTIQAQVVHVVSSEGFNTQSLFVAKEETVEPEVEEQEPVVVEEVHVHHAEEPVHVQEVVHHVHHTETHHHHHHHHHVEHKEHAVEVVHHHVEHKEVAQEHTTEHVQGETTTAEGEAPKEHNGEKKFNKKPYQKRINSGGERKPREPREPRGEGENTQQQGENGEHKRGHRQHHNGPRHGGNRSGNKRHEGENNENQENTNVVNDGWNVVTKGPQKPEYKPRREGGAHHHNKERPQGQGEQGQKRGDGQKRPNHSGNKRPFNKDRPQGEQGQNQNQYVRKEKTATEAPEQPAQN